VIVTCHDIKNILDKNIAELKELVEMAELAKDMNRFVELKFIAVKIQQVGGRVEVNSNYLRIYSQEESK
jgi:hypothetical protein